MKRILLISCCIGFAFSVAQAQFRKKITAPVSRTEQKSPSLNYNTPTEYTIAGIEVVGLNVLDKNAMISLTGLKIGDVIKVPGTATATAVRRLWKHGLVGDVSISADRIEGSNVYLTVRLTERPRLTDFYFRGLSQGKQTALKQDMHLIRGKIVTEAMIRNAESSVRKHFVKKGFLNTQVKIVKERDTLNRGGVRLRIDVDVQSKVKISNIVFEGNEITPEAMLKKKLKKTHERARLTIHRTLLSSVFDFKPRYIKEYFDSSRQTSWKEMKHFINTNIKLNIFRGSKFIRAEYEEDKKKVVDYLNSQGFRDAAMVSDSVINYNSGIIDLKLKIYEGRKYYFRNVTWTGNYLYASATLDKVLDIKKGDVYSQELIDRKTTFNPKGGADISGLYMDDGYLFFRVTPVEVAVVGDSIDVEMRIFEGDQAIVDQVTITGNERTSEHVIRRELTTIPGQKFRRADIIRTQQQLSQMGYFNAQKIEQDIRPNPANGTVNIGWKLEEQSNDQVQLSGGWGGYYGFVGTVGLTFNNFSLRNVPHLKKWRPLPVGDGQRLSLQMQANGKSFQSYSISFTEPWLSPRKPNSLTVSLNHSISRIPTGQSGSTLNFDASSAYLKQSGITLGLGRRLEWPDNYFTLTNSLSFLQYNYHNYFGATSALPATGTTNSIIFNTTLSRNSIDNPMYPTSGSTISLSLNLTPPYSLWRSSDYYKDIATKYNWLELYKWMFDSKFYIKVLGSKKPEGRSLVIETKANFGYIGTYNNRIGGPGPFERFLMGGAGLTGGFNSFVLGQDIIGLRGYQDNHVTPPLYDRYGAASSSIQGGIVYNKYSMEMRYPVVTSQAATVYSFVFTEAGNNWDKYQDVNPFNLYRSAGFGARIFMPAFGLIGLNWAYGFDTLPNANHISGSQFHFTIGNQIR